MIIKQTLQQINTLRRKVPHRKKSMRNSLMRLLKIINLIIISHHNHNNCLNKNFKHTQIPKRPLIRSTKSHLILAPRGPLWLILKCQTKAWSLKIKKITTRSILQKQSQTTTSQTAKNPKRSLDQFLHLSIPIFQEWTRRRQRRRTAWRVLKKWKPHHLILYIHRRRRRNHQRCRRARATQAELPTYWGTWWVVVLWIQTTQYWWCPTVVIIITNHHLLRPNRVVTTRVVVFLKETSWEDQPDVLALPLGFLRTNSNSNSNKTTVLGMYYINSLLLQHQLSFTKSFFYDQLLCDLKVPIMKIHYKC